MSRPPSATLSPPDTTVRIAATEARFEVGRDPVEIELAPVATDVGGRPLSRPGAEPRYLLHLEGVQCAGHPGSYDVYVNVPAGARAEDHPDRMAGRVSLVGPRQEPGEPPHTFDVVLDASRVQRRLAARPEGAADRIRVTIVPVYDWSDPLTVGRLSLNIG